MRRRSFFARCVGAGLACLLPAPAVARELEWRVDVARGIKRVEFRLQKVRELIAEIDEACVARAHVMRRV
jgi:hypothetical protein